MRQLFDLYICLRPCKAYPGNPLNLNDGIDIVVFRENTEDLYAGVEFNPVPDALADTLRQLSKPFAPLRRPQGRRVRRVVQDQHAQGLRAHHRRGLRVRAQARAQEGHHRAQGECRARDRRDVPRDREEVAARYPEITFDEANVDAMTMWLLKNPLSYDVLVAPNLYGDIVSDLCAQMVGGLGFACSGNIGEKLGVFEPSHGSAPKYAGQYKVNPIATILTAKMMLDWLGEQEMGARVERATAAVIKQGQVRTYDMGGTDHFARDGRGHRAGALMSGVMIHEVGLRDGLQIEDAGRPDRPQARSGSRASPARACDMIQVGSFVNPQKVPQMADTDELFRRLRGGPAPAGRRLLGPRAQREGPRTRASPAASTTSAWASRPATRTAGRTPA